MLFRDMGGADMGCGRRVEILYRIDGLVVALECLA